MAKLNETAATLRISGATLDPCEITRLLGKKPSMAHKKGDEAPLRNGRGFRIARTGMWSILTEREMPGNIGTQVEKLLEGINADTSVWLQISGELKVEIFCGLFLKQSNEGLEISRATMMMLGSRGISLDLDIYGADGDEAKAKIIEPQDR